MGFIRPNDRHHKKVMQGRNDCGYNLSKEDIDVQGSLKAGLSVVVTKVASADRTLPSKYAAAFIGDGAQHQDVMKGPWNKKLGPFAQYGVRTLGRDPKSGNYETHKVGIGNDKTGTIYLITFEAPADEWESAWKVGEQILKNFVLDSDI